MRYEIVKDHGALLALQGCGHGEMAERTGEWPDYIARNHGEWYRWASQNVERDIRKEDIIVIQGYIRARDWYLAAFPSKSSQIQLSLDGRFIFGGVGGGVNIQNADYIAPEYRRSTTFRIPQAPHNLVGRGQETIPRDCIFLRAFRLKRMTALKYRISNLVVQTPTNNHNTDFNEHRMEGSAYDAPGTPNTSNMPVSSQRTVATDSSFSEQLGCTTDNGDSADETCLLDASLGSHEVG